MNVGGYQLLRAIAQGSYGTVWLARNQTTRRLFALKIVAEDTFKDARPYRREFEALQAFEPISRSHPGFVNILHVGEMDGGFFYVMELADDILAGREIDPVRYEPKTLKNQHCTVSDAIRLGISLVEAIAALHRNGLLHRDIKPSNIIYVSGQPKLADIGLVANVKEAHSFVGTEGFIPPEGPTSVQADLFALGKVLYELATGLDRLSFPALPDESGPEHELLIQLNEVLLRACNKERRLRYASAEEFLADLHLLQSGRSLSRLRFLEKRARMLAKSLLIVLLASVAIFAVGMELMSRSHRIASERERQIATSITRGTERLQQGDFSTAIRDFLPLLYEDKAHSNEYRLRLGSIVASAPEPIRVWRGLSGASAQSSDGRVTATGNGSHVALYDTINGVLETNLAIHGTSIALDSIGSKLAIVDGTAVREFALPSGEPLKDYSFVNNPRHVAFGPDSKSLAISFTNKVIVLNDFKALELVCPGKLEIFRTFFSPTGSLLASGTRDGLLLIWDLRTGRLLSRLPQHRGILYSATVDGGDEYVTTTSADRTVAKWRIDSGDRLEDLAEHENGVLAAVEFPDRRGLASIGLDRTLKLVLDLGVTESRRSCFLRLPHDLDELYRLSSNRFLTISVGGTAIVWQLPEANANVTPVPFQPLPPKMAIAGRSIRLEATTNVVTIVAPERRVEVIVEEPVQMIALDPKEGLIAVATQDESRKGHAARLYDTNGRLRRVRFPHDDGIIFVAFSHHGDRLVTCGEDFVAKIWDLDGRQIGSPLRHRWQVRWADFSADDRWLATAGWDHAVIVWDAKTGDQLSAPIYFPRALEYVAFEDATTVVVSDLARRRYRLKLPLLDANEESRSFLLHPELLPKE